MENVIIGSLVTAGAGVLLLVLVWPVRKAAAKLLRRWGVPDPGESDVDEALAYLKRRRFWYPPLFFGLPYLLGLIDAVPQDNTAWWIIATVLTGGLLAEAFALRKPRHARREALLVRRRVVDLVPWWALLAFAVAAVAALVRLSLLRSWGNLAITAAVCVITALIVAFAVRRPVTGRVEVDLALRTRSARVATGLGVLVVGLMADPDPGTVSWVITLAALLVAWAVVAPVKRVAVPA